MLQDKFTKKWSKIIVKDKTKRLRSYVVNDEKRKLLKRKLYACKKWIIIIWLDKNEDEINNNDVKLEEKREQKNHV